VEVGDGGVDGRRHREILLDRGDGQAETAQRSRRVFAGFAVPGAE
jgi:hypothetical protein